MTVQVLPRPEMSASLSIRAHACPVVVRQAAGRTIHFSSSAELVPGALLEMTLSRGDASTLIRIQIQGISTGPPIPDVERRKSYRARIVTTLLPDWLSWQLDTRSAFRVEVDPSTTISVKLKLGSQRFRGRLLDASQDGVAILCRTDLETASQLGVKMELEFDLPEGRCRFFATLRRLKEAEAECRMGIELVDDGSLDYRRARSVLRSYVMRRQREIAQTRVQV